jgi:hypothetical protein
MTPNSTVEVQPGQPAKVVPVDLQGSGFPENPTVTLSGTTQGVSNVRRVSSTNITASFTFTDASVAGEYRVVVSGAGAESNPLNFMVTNPTGSPTFNLTATPQTISGPDGELSEQMIDFAVTSVNGFTGPVVVQYTPGVAMSTEPARNGFTVNVVPGQPATFSQRFRRAGYPGGPETMTWTATHAASSTTKQVVISVTKQ